MRFGPVPPREALGAVAVHTIRGDGVVLKKGTVLGEAEIAALEAAGIAEIVVAQLDPGDVGEDEAAGKIAAAMAGEGVRVDRPFTGRANLFAEYDGVLALERAAIERLNRVDEAVTAATLPEFRAVVAGEMIGTVKIIPFAVPQSVLDRALETVRDRGPVRVVEFSIKNVAVVSTLLPGLKPSVIGKTLRATEARLAPAGARLVADLRVPHDAGAVAEAIGKAKAAGAELTIVFGASAIADRRDVIPAALEQAGGNVVHLGMPVDPGNLLLVGELDGRPVLGAPGCARSPKENGFDWVLTRLLAGLPVTREDITAMGVGGLLMEIVSRPQPREGAPEQAPHKVAAIVLAAGRSTRMGGPNKLLADFGGRPLVRVAVEHALASRASPVIVVTGHQHEQVAAALAGLPVTLVHNPRFAEGLSTTLAAGIAAVPAEADAALVCLADMPGVDAATLDRLIGAFSPAEGAAIVLPTFKGKRGNPVLWARRFFPELLTLAGDVGARHLIGTQADAVREVAVDAPNVMLDVDTPEALRGARETYLPPAQR